MNYEKNIGNEIRTKHKGEIHRNDFFHILLT